MVRISISTLFLLLLMILAFSGFAEIGDVNADDTINVDDALVLRDYLVGNPVAVNERNADINEDGQVNMIDLVLLERMLGYLAPDVTPSPEPFHHANIVKEIVYGQSERGRDLICTIIEPSSYTRTVLVNFAIHGFEDWYDHDAQVLVDTAQMTIDHFRDADLGDCRLMVVSCANPDGLIEGYTKNGFGRCNANGVDLNRDFDAAHTVMTNARNYTLYPFSAAESRALRDLVLANHPEVVLDCHGWENCTIGDSELAKVFYEETGLVHHVTFSDNCHGYFSYWAHQQGALALLVEFTNPNFDKQPFLNAMDRLIRGDYETETGDFTRDERFSMFSNIKTYTLSKGDVITYSDFNGTSSGKIFGSSDLCIIEKVYQNGWVRVNYPISSGTKSAYCPLSEFIDPEQQIDLQSISFEKNETVYRRQDLSESFGTVYSSDRAYCVAQSGEAVQILYPLDSGGWKMGWVSASTISEHSEGDFHVVMRSGSQALTGEIYFAPGIITEGKNLALPVCIQGEDIIALRLWLIYDNDALKLVSVSNGEVLGGMTLKTQMDDALYCMLWSDSLKEGPHPIHGTLAELQFNIRENVEQSEVSILCIIQSGDAYGGNLNQVIIEQKEALLALYASDKGVLYIPKYTAVIKREAFAGCAFETV